MDFHLHVHLCAVWKYGSTWQMSHIQPPGSPVWFPTCSCVLKVECSEGRGWFVLMFFRVCFEALMAKSMRPDLPPQKLFAAFILKQSRSQPWKTFQWSHWDGWRPLVVESFLCLFRLLLFFKRSLLSFQDVTPVARGFVTCCRLFSHHNGHSCWWRREAKIR